MRRVGVLATLLVAFVIVGVACPARCLAGTAPAHSAAPPCHGHEDAPPATDGAGCCEGMLAVRGAPGAPDLEVKAAPTLVPVVLPVAPAVRVVRLPAPGSVVRLGSPPTPLYRRTCALLL